MKPGVVVGKLGTIHPEIGTILIIHIADMKVPVCVMMVGICNPPIGMKAPYRTTMEPKHVVAGTSRNNPAIPSPSVAGNGDYCVVCKVGFEILSGPNQIIAIKVHDWAAVETVLNPLRIAGDIVGVVAFT